MPISAIELPSAEDDHLPEYFEAVLDDSGLDTLPQPTISQPMQDGIVTFASSVKIGWRQMILYGTQMQAGTSYSFNSTFGNTHVYEYVNKNLVPDYVYSMGWPAKTQVTGGAWLNCVYAAVCTEPFDLEQGSQIAGNGFAITLQVLHMSGRYSYHNTSLTPKQLYTICLVDDTGTPIKYIDGVNSFGSKKTAAFNSTDGRTFKTNFDSYSFEADQDYTGVRLAVFTVGASEALTQIESQTCVYVPQGGASESPDDMPMIYVKTSVVEGNGSGQDNTSGLLASIIEWLSRILNGITAIPGAIANLGTTILEGLKGLFIPSGDELSATMSDFKDWLDTNFPLLALPINILNGFLQFVNLTDGTLPEITFPAFSVGDVVISSGYTFKFAEIPHLETLLPYIRTITTIAVYSAFFAWVWRNIAAIINGSATDFDDGTFDLFDHYRGG